MHRARQIPFSSIFPTPPLYFDILSNARLPKGYTYISPDDAKDVLVNMNVSKASGHDLVNPKLLTESAPLSDMFNNFIAQSYFPSSWKIANFIIKLYRLIVCYVYNF